MNVNAHIRISHIDGAASAVSTAAQQFIIACLKAGLSIGEACQAAGDIPAMLQGLRFSIEPTPEEPAQEPPPPKTKVTKPQAGYFAWLAEQGVEDNGFVQWVGREMFGVKSRAELSAEQWGELLAFSTSKGKEWYRRGSLLWETLKDARLGGVEKSLLAFLPHQFQCKSLLQTDQQVIEKCADGVRKHLEKDAEAFVKKVLAWDATRGDGQVPSMLADRLDKLAEEDPNAREKAARYAKERFGVESLGAMEEWQAVWLLNRL